MLHVVHDFLLAVLAELVWDPLSTAETVRFVNLMQKLQRDYPTVNGGAKNTQVRLTAILVFTDNITVNGWYDLHKETTLIRLFLHFPQFICLSLPGSLDNMVVDTLCIFLYRHWSKLKSIVFCPMSGHPCSMIILFGFLDLFSLKLCKNTNMYVLVLGMRGPELFTRTDSILQTWLFVILEVLFHQLVLPG